MVALDLLGDHLRHATFGQPERLFSDGRVNPPHYFFVARIGRLECRLKRHGNFVHAISGSRRRDPLGGRRDVDAGKLAGVRNVWVKHNGRNSLQVIDRRLGHRTPGISANNECGITVATHEHIDGRELTRIVTWVAAIEADPKREAGLPPHDHIGASYISVASHRHGNKFGKGIHLGCEREQCRAVHMFSTRHREPHTEEHAAELGAFHTGHQIVKSFTSQTGFRNLCIGHLLFLDQCPEDRDQLKVFARPHLQEDVGSLHAFGFADIDQHHGAIFTSFGQELALLHERVFGEVSRMTLGRIAAPIDDEVGSLFHFTERAGYLATQLSGDLGRAMSQGCVAIEQTAQAVCQSHTLFLCFAGGVAHSVDERHIGFVQQSRRFFDRFIHRSLFAINQRGGVFFFRRVVEKPCRSQHAGFLRLVNPHLIVVQLNVVADTAAKSAGGIINDLQRFF